MKLRFFIILILMLLVACQDAPDPRLFLREDLKGIPPADDHGIIRAIHVLTIDGVSNVFNPSLVSASDSTYLTVFGFGHSDSLVSAGEIRVGIAELDASFRQIGETQTLDIHEKYIHDPRIVRIGAKFYIVYSAATTGPRRVYIAHIERDNNNRWCVNSNHKIHFNLQSEEKNWAAFDYEGRFLLSYSYQPHKVLEYDLNKLHNVAHFSESEGVTWNFGEIRGGTPALLDDGEYVSFFHSHVKSSRGTVVYYMGAVVLRLTRHLESKRGQNSLWYIVIFTRRIIPI